MIIKQITKTTNILYIDEPLSYEYDSNSSSIVLLDNFKYEIFYDKYKLTDTIDLREDRDE